VDAIGYAVNTLVDELSITIQRLEQEAAERRVKETELVEAERRQKKIDDELQSLRLARLASIGSLAAGVGHEINNPLTYVMANLDLIEQRLGELVPESSSREAAEVFELIRESGEGAERIRRIVQELRLFARVDVEPDRLVDARKVMETSLSLVDNEIRYRATLVRNYGDVPPVWGSETRLAQVFVNLLVNAAHSLPTGSALEHTIRISIERSGEEKLAIEIEDTGIGIPREDLPRVFGPFFTTKAVGEGTGLGLPICRQLVTEMGGEISVVSDIAVGSTFRVLIPIGEANHAVETPTKLQSIPDAARVPRVLIIDDEPQVAAVLKRMSGCAESTILNGGREALELLEKDYDFDLVFCDLMMSEMSGMELFRLVEEFAPHLSDRFVFVTGGAFTTSINRFLDSVPNRCVLKPFNGGEICRIVQLSVCDESRDGGA
jgi:signal transduction histidine kinase